MNFQNLPRWLVVLTASVPVLLAYSLTPVATIFNQLAAVGGWGLLLLFLQGDEGELRRAVLPAMLALLVLMFAAGASPLWTGLPVSLALSSASLLLAALALLLAAGRLSASAAQAWWTACCWALLLASAGSAAVAAVQVFAPAWADGDWIARSGVVGRAVGNMRQPNHLASLMMWAAVAAVWLSESGAWARRRHTRLMLPLLLWMAVFTIVLSASRTGLLGLLVLAIWGALDRKLAPATRWSLAATPLMLGLSWWLMSLWAHSGGHAFGAESRLAEGAGSPSRLAILANSWTLLKMQPWTGVGWGEFNLAWTMTPFPDRPVAFFDHSHNLAMQLLVELGLPLGAAVLLLLGWSLWRAWRLTRQATGPRAVMLSTSLMLVLTIGLHSLLEYPLWYSYFLLPTAFALGLCLGGGAERAERGAVVSELAWRLGLKSVGLLLVVGSLFAVWDYLRVVAIYMPPAQAAPLAERIAVGQRSVFFASQADYAAATSLGKDAAALEATRRTAHNLIDVRLMMAWAKSLHAAGDTDKARYVVARLREFRSPAAEDWLAECDEPERRPQPFQCEPPQRDYNWRELR